MAKDLVLEIGLEEVPARFMADSLKQLAQKAEKLFIEQRLAYKAIDTYGTPRRLTLYVTGLEETQGDVSEEIKGPPSRIAFDADGKPTKAAAGFARSQNVELEDLIVREVEGGSYVFVVKQVIGQKTSEVLQKLLHELITGLSFPKSMRWGEEEMRFVRPIRWLLALFGGEVVSLELAGVRSGNFTYGHRFLSDGPIQLDRAENYFDKLEQGYVMVDQTLRQERIWQQIEALAVGEKGKVEPDSELLEEVTYLVEYPTAICGSFDEKYLQLPDEVLITPMREHQRYFPVRGEQGKLKPLFITVKNGTEEHSKLVVEGNEKVLAARLADARFFWEEDLKRPLKDRVEELENIVFQEELGSMLQKVRRTGRLAEELCSYLNQKPELQILKKVALLAKTDLVTNMVYEFPELQGIMGCYYAAQQGEPEAVATGIREHYLPRFAGDELPQSAVGIAVALADKLDSLVGYFSLGLKPTGSQDPYALRRQALGITAIILGKEIDFSLEEAIRSSYRLYERKSLKLKEDEVVNELLQFFNQRLENILQDRGFSYDVAAAVLTVAGNNPLDALRRCEALSEFRSRKGFDRLLAAYTRANNLAKKAAEQEVDPGLFREEAEEKLWESFKDNSKGVKPLLEEKNYLAALEKMADLRQDIDNYFETIMVMVEDERLRNNRLGVLKNVSSYLSVVADLSQIVS